MGVRRNVEGYGTLFVFVISYKNMHFICDHFIGYSSKKMITKLCVIIMPLPDIAFLSQIAANVI